MARNKRSKKGGSATGVSLLDGGTNTRARFGVDTKGKRSARSDRATVGERKEWDNSKCGGWSKYTGVLRVNGGCAG